MTILVSNVSEELIVMLSDSTITTTHIQDEQGNYFNEYETGSKFYKFPGIGCVTTWGDHTYNRLSSFLQRQGTLSVNTHSIDDLATLVHRYIADEYRKDNTDEIGFHIGGFNRDGRPRLYHTFWGFDRPRREGQELPTIHLYDHSNLGFLYNGRNDLAHIVITSFLNQIGRGEDTRFDLSRPLGRICLCDFVARFAAEITPQVGPPFVIHLIFPDNSIEKIENTSFSPISVENMLSVLPKVASLRDGSRLDSIGDNDNSYRLTSGTVSVFSETPSPYGGGTICNILPSGTGG